FLEEQPDLGTKWAPRFVRVTGAVPLTASGKVDKRPLRRALWNTDDPVWWRPFAPRAAAGRPGSGPAPLAYRRLTPADAAALAAQFAAHGRRDLLEA
ncbi:MAG TPA: hypothetical protein VLZ77_07230, partial [Acidimicrobiales bacterium]|nr:hypothetical protein [Acidimicrobiales bacterium]